MIYITLYLLYSLALLFVIGSMTQRLFERLALFPDSRRWSIDFSNNLTLGIITLTTLVSFISIISPIAEHVHLVVTLLVLIYIYIDRKYTFHTFTQLIVQIKSSPYLFTLGSICVFAATIHAAGPVTLFDTGLYHAQAVKWIDEYGSVPGLGNLHHRLAFNSSWFCFSAFFDMMAFTGKTAHLVNLIVFTLGLVICFNGFSNISKGNISISHMMKCFLALPLCIDRLLLIDFLPSLSPDLAVFLFIIYVLILSIEYMEQKDMLENDLADAQSKTFIMILCISFFLPTVKLNSLPILLLPFLAFIITKTKTAKLLGISSILGLIILLPFLIRNIILSGYLIFPFQHIDLFNLDWKIPYKGVELVRKGIKYFAFNPRPGAAAWSVAGMSTAELIKFWFYQNYKHTINYWIISSVFLVIVFYIICFKRKLSIRWYFLGLQGILLLGVAYWFFSAPLYRFGKGWLWGFIISSLASLSYLIAKTLRIQFVGFLSRVFVVVICVTLINTLLLRWDSLEGVFGPPSDFLWRIRDLPKEKMKVVEIHEGFILNVAPRERAWNADLPNSPYEKSNLRMRGTTLKEGFRVVK